MRHTYHVYALSNANRTALYLGVTNDLARRLGEHRTGSGDAFTSRYKTTDLLWFEAFPSIAEAIAREKQLKRWHREWKWNLITAANPELRDLTPELIHLR